MSKDRMSYSDKLLDPRWQKRRLVIFERDRWRCRLCDSDANTLNVHHRWYERGQEPWDAPDSQLVTLCALCHKMETEARPGVENHLLRILRREFFASDLADICSAFQYMRTAHQSRVVAAALDHFLTEITNVNRMVEEHLEYLKAMEAEQEVA